MAKTEIVHARVTKTIKTESDRLFSSLGLTTSQAITLFLTASVNHRGIPFELSMPRDDNQELDFAKSVAMVDGVAPSKGAERILGLYARGEIDYETAQFAIGRLYQ